jgi:hypothetical protein
MGLQFLEALPMRTQVEFRSSKFPSLGTEEEGVNFSVGVYGKAIAQYFYERLPVQGIAVMEPYPEDWGWCIEVMHDGGFLMFVGCGHQVPLDNEQLADDRFVCNIYPGKPYIRRERTPNPT